MNGLLAAFLLGGTFSMSAALSVQALMKKNASEITAELMIWGNLGALVLILSAVYGALNLNGWMVLCSLFVTFPILHFVILKKILSGRLAARVYGALSALPAVWMILNW
ncbi:hypothetical protein [Pokkaliibacter plantistimulans]|nr:hypothetical protein [Pokkaliibacter plantistimulans]